MSHQSPSSPRPRRPATFSTKLEKRLVAYVAAAGAAGSSLLTAQPAEAKVVFTRTNTAIRGNLPIDLNNDGIVDFTVQILPFVNHTVFLNVAPNVTGNAIRDDGSGAAAGFFGVPVGPGGKFATNTSYLGQGVFMARFYQYSQTSFSGPWADAVNRYLGLKFLIDGKVHYGWARLSVPSIGGTVLTGYAYETRPNTRIIAGHTTDAASASNFIPDDQMMPCKQPASLGVLARGADGLAIWRRDEDAKAR